MKCIHEDEIAKISNRKMHYCVQKIENAYALCYNKENYGIF